MLCMCIVNWQSLIMFWNMYLSRLHFIWAITLICKYTWFNYPTEKSWKIPSCSWLIASLSTIPQISFLEFFFSHGDLGNSSQISHLGNQDIWYTSLFYLLLPSKLPWQWECCSFYLGKMTFSNICYITS